MSAWPDRVQCNADFAEKKRKVSHSETLTQTQIWTQVIKMQLQHPSVVM